MKYKKLLHFQKFKDWVLNFLKHLLTKILNVLKGLNPSKASGIENLSGKFLKDGAAFLARPISQLCNLSIKLNLCPRSCKIVKVYWLFKRLQNDPQNYHIISLIPILYKKLLKRLFTAKHKNFCKQNSLKISIWFPKTLFN